jgi:hypothetical protein
MFIAQKISCTGLSRHWLITSCLVYAPRPWSCAKAVQESEKADHGWRTGIMNRIAQLISVGAEDNFGGNQKQTPRPVFSLHRP